MNEHNELKFDMEKAMNDKQPVYISVRGFALADFKNLIRQYAECISTNRVTFVVLEHEVCQLSDEIKKPIDMLVQRNILRLVNTKDWNSAFAAIKESTSRTYLIVHDMLQRKEILDIAKTKGVFVNFLKIDDSGMVEPWPKAAVGERRMPAQQELINNHVSHFTVATRPEQIRITRLNVKQKMATGSCIYSESGKSYLLRDIQMSNNGASSYRTNIEGIWVKLYDEATLNSFTEAKVRRMLTKEISCKGVCWPLEIAVDSDGIFRGYFFSEANGEPLHLAILKESGLKKYFPDWTKRDLTLLLKTLLQKIVYLHDRGVLFGCINPASIRVVNQQEVYFVDTDNYQIEGFPTTVYNLSFTPPEYVGRRVYLSTLDSENFAIAELVFMVMMAGKSPYAEGIISDPEKIIQNMKFLYPSGKIHGSAALPGSSRFMWSHLTPFKVPLFETLQSGGRYNALGQRRNVRFWLGVVNRFSEELEKPYDSESLKIFPRTFKRFPDSRFIKCDYCGVEHPDFFYSQQNYKFPNTLNEFRICNTCYNQRSDVYFVCEDCGRKFYYTNSTAIFHRRKKESDAAWKDQRHCADCKKKLEKCVGCGKMTPHYQLKNGRCHECNDSWRNAVYKYIQCRDCGRSFGFTNGDREYYMKKGFNEPSRCPDCRANKSNSQRSSSNSYSSYSRTQTQYSQGGYNTRPTSQRNTSQHEEAPKKKGLLERLFGK